MPIRYVTPKEAAGLLRVNERTVRRWIREGKIRARRFGRLLRIRMADLDAEPSPATWASDRAFKDDWDNPLDADYDNWREVYGVR